MRRNAIPFLLLFLVNPLWATTTCIAEKDANFVLYLEPGDGQVDKARLVKQDLRGNTRPQLQSVLREGGSYHATSDDITIYGLRKTDLFEITVNPLGTIIYSVDFLGEGPLYSGSHFDCKGPGATNEMQNLDSRTSIFKK